MSTDDDSRRWREIISPPLVVREEEGWGRGVYTTEPLLAGVEVMKAEPLAHVLSNDFRNQLCNYCLNESQSLLKCGRCKFVYYCNKSCQRGDWIWHAGECRGIERARPHFPTPLIRLVVRCLHKESKERTWEVDLLCSNEKRLSSVVRSELNTLLVGVRLLLDNPNQIILERAWDLLCKALCNTFTIHGTGLDPIGAGLYVGPSLVNHSCLPNCVAVFNGCGLTIRTISSINPGDQLLMSYVDLLDPLEERQNTLLKSYSFNCQCNRCLTELTPDSPFNSMYTLTEGSQSVSVEHLVKKETERLKEIDQLRLKGDNKHVFKEYQEALIRQSQTLSSYHYLSLRTHQRLVLTAIGIGDWSVAIETSRKLTHPLIRYLPQYHPVLAIHLMRLGKLLRVSGSSEHLRESAIYLSQAVELLKVVHGSRHSSTISALQLLQDSQAELSSRGCIS